MKASGLLRAGWNLVDQVISSATNALLSFLIARSVTDSEFGGFSVAFTIFSVFIGVSRAVAASPMSVRFAGSERDEFRRATASGVGTALACVVVGGALGLSLLVPGLGIVRDGIFLFLPVTLSIHAVLAPLLLVGGIGGVVLGGAQGAAWGFAAAFWAMVPVWWIRVQREAKALAASNQ